MQLDDRFYTSTEVAEILGVSLRSVYRYLEDSKLKAEVKTATGRHRFTKQDIINFLYPDGQKSPLVLDEQQVPTKERTRSEIPNIREELPRYREVKNEVRVEEYRKTAVEEKEEEPVDWLSKFREAATKYKEEPTPRTASRDPMPQPEMDRPIERPVERPVYQYQTNAQSNMRPQAQEPVNYYRDSDMPLPQKPREPQMASTPSLFYYRSMLGGLKDIAQNIDKSARNSNLDYAFTLNAGASLHKPIKPFATLHAYVRSMDKDFFEKILRLTPASQSNAQLCLIISDSASLYNNRDEIHGLFVVSRDQLKKDIALFGDPQLAQEISDVIL